MKPYRTTLINIFISFLSSGCLTLTCYVQFQESLHVYVFYFFTTGCLQSFVGFTLICLKCIYMCCYAHFELANVENENNDRDKQSAEVEM